MQDDEQLDIGGTVTPEQAKQLSKLTIENIKAKITDGGVPTLREAQLLAAAKVEPDKGKAAPLMLGVDKIAAMYPRAKINGRSLSTIAAHASVPSVKGEGFDVRLAVEALLCHYKEVAERAKDQREKDIDRARAADAETAELRAAHLRGSLASKSDLAAIMADYFARSRAVIETSDDLTAAQRKKLFAKLNAITLSELPDAKPEDEE